MRRNKNSDQATADTGGGWVEVKGGRRRGKREVGGGDATPPSLPSLEHHHPLARKVTWAGKVRGKQVEGEQRTGRSGVGGSSASPTSPSSPFSPRTLRQRSSDEGVQGASERCWRGVEGRGTQGKTREEEEEWDMHSDLTWADQVDASREVWYGPDGSVVGVGPPSPTSPPLLTLQRPQRPRPRPSFTPHAHADTPTLTSSHLASSPAQRRRGWESRDKSATSPSCVPPSNPVQLGTESGKQRWDKGERERTHAREGNRTDSKGNGRGTIAEWDQQGNGKEMKRGIETEKREEEEEGIKVKSEHRGLERTTKGEETEKQAIGIYLAQVNKEKGKERDRTSDTGGKGKRRRRGGKRHDANRPAEE